jgi:hypothetical protein
MFKFLLLNLVLNIINEANGDILYPFGTSNGDTLAQKSDDINIGPISFKYITGFQYFDKQFSSLYINPNGLISFDSSYLGNNGSKYNYPNDVFTALAPFWSKMSALTCGDIYYREIIDKVSPFADTLIDITFDIEIAIQNSADPFFLATWAFIVTFDRVCSPNNNDTEMTNSFQIVITADDTRSYVIYNYDKLNWYDDGLSYALFNAGDGKRYSILPGSLTIDILKLSSLSNVDALNAGKWIFNIGTFKSTSTSFFIPTYTWPNTFPIQSEG